MFESVQYVEHKGELTPRETVVGVFADEIEAVRAAREARRLFMQSDSTDYAWWTVKESGATLANFIADSRSNKEFVLDLTAGELVELPQ